MNRLNLFFFIFSLSAAPALAAPVYELSTLVGTPNSEMPFVKEVVKDQISLGGQTGFADITTGILYFAWRNGTKAAQTIQVLREGGNAALEDVYRAIEIASRDAAVVLVPLSGEGVEEMCARMWEKKDTAFLVTLGTPGYTFSPLDTKCAAPNILFVTVLNPELNDLGEFASYGPLVRLAVPGMNLSAPVEGERRVSYLSDAFGMAVAAGKLSHFLRENPGLKGAGLLRKFLAEAETLPALRGKVTGAKALLKFEK